MNNLQRFKNICLAAASYLLLASIGCVPRESAPPGDSAAASKKLNTKTNEQFLPEWARDQSPSAESLKNVVVGWRNALLSYDPGERKAAVAAMMPRREDVEVLFSDREQVLTRYFSIDRRQKEYRARWRGAFDLRTDVERLDGAEFITINLRAAERKSRGTRALLKLIPKNTPVYGVDIEYEYGGCGYSAFLHVNGRWIWCDDFDDIAEALEELTDDELNNDLDEMDDKLSAKEDAYSLEAAEKEEVSEYHYGLLVYTDHLDEPMALEPTARFVRAVYRKQGQSFPRDYESTDKQVTPFVARLGRFGRGLRQAMTDAEVARLEKLVQEGHLFGVKAGGSVVSWKSLHRNADKVGVITLVQVGKSVQHLFRPKPPESNDLTLSPSLGAKALKITDGAVRRQTLFCLATADLDSQYRKEILNALLAIQTVRPAQPSQHLPAVFTRWATKDDLEVLERMLAEGNLNKTDLVRVFLRMAKLDEQRAVAYASQRATDAALVYLTDYELSERVTRLAMVQEKNLPNLLDDDGSKSDFGEFEIDKNRLDSLYRSMIEAFLKSGDKDRVSYANRLIRNHFPDCGQQPAP